MPPIFMTLVSMTTEKMVSKCMTRVKKIPTFAMEIILFEFYAFLFFSHLPETWKQCVPKAHLARCHHCLTIIDIVKSTVHKILLTAP